VLRKKNGIGRTSDIYAKKNDAKDQGQSWKILSEEKK
jgi:hypothetical protein